MGGFLRSPRIRYDSEPILQVGYWIHGTKSMDPWNQINGSMEPNQWIHGTKSMDPWNQINGSMEPNQWIHGTKSSKSKPYILVKLLRPHATDFPPNGGEK